jgi:hypothetical protein
MKEECVIVSSCKGNESLRSKFKAIDRILAIKSE